MTPLRRREVLKQLGLTGVGMALSACGGSNGDGDATPTATPTAESPQTPTSTRTPPPTATPTATSPAATPTATEIPTSTEVPTAIPTATSLPTPSCILTPRQAEGPFFLDTGLLRRDLTEGLAGAPLQLALFLVDVDDRCTPIRDAVVEAWHADFDGVYSGFTRAQGNPRDAGGETFLRGFQVSDEGGRVVFDTIYPGWYPGRTVHIHIKVLLDGTRLITSQLYFPESVTDEVYAEPPYDARGPRGTTNASDGLFRIGGEDLIVDVDGSSSGAYSASFVVGVTG